MNCASYWWTRIAACGIRATHHLLGSCLIDMLLYADDLDSKGADSHRPQLLLSHCARVSLQIRGISGRVARYGEATLARRWWSSATQGRQGPMSIPTMLRVLFSWLADRLEGDRLQRSSRPPSGDLGLSFFTDAKVKDGRAWVGLAA